MENDALVGALAKFFIENALTTGEITLYGDGSDSLDFTYIKDLVTGVEKIIGNPNAVDQIFNITYGKGRSLDEMASIVKEHFPDIKIKYEPKDKLTPDRGSLSIDKAIGLINYSPEYSLEKGYTKYISWYKHFHENPPRD